MSNYSFYARDKAAEGLAFATLAAAIVYAMDLLVRWHVARVVVKDDERGARVTTVYAQD